MHVKTLEISLYTFLAYLLKLWHTGISLLHKVDILHGFRIILFYRTIDKELIAVFEIAECTEMEIQQNSHDVTVRQRGFASSTLDLSVVFKQISYILGIKRFAELVDHTYSEVSLNEAKSFVIGSHVKDFCNRLTFTYKYKGTKQCETTNYLSAISYPEQRYQLLFLTSPGFIPNSSLKHLAK